MKIRKLYFDMDGVLCNFDTQYKKALTDERVFHKAISQLALKSKNKLNKLHMTPEEFEARVAEIRKSVFEIGPTDTYNNFKKTTKGELNISAAWAIIIAAGVEFWSEMEWNPGGKELYSTVTKLCDQLGIEVEILTAGSGPTAEIGKKKWLYKHGINVPFNIVSSGAHKHRHPHTNEDLLIDDMKSNIEEWIATGGIGIQHTDTSITLKQLFPLLHDESRKDA